ncbi:hypothetical protein MMC07_004599 [Pseudocyphellaria aurata]|nr:hypothetical protein [Pseudocyphellaria aurata]
MDQDQQQALDIFAKAWKSDNPDVEEAAKALCKGTTEAEDQREYISSTILAIHQYACTQPASIDLSLRIFHRAFQQYPNTIRNGYCSGPVAGQNQLKWWLIEEASCFEGLQSRRSTGTVNSHDNSNLDFSEQEVADNMTGVLAQIAEWKKRRRDQLITAAIFARCHALNVFRFDDSQRAEYLIDMGLNHRPGAWSHSEFFAACVLLRGCASSLSSIIKPGKMNEWRSQFARHLREHDFVIKSQAALVLRNLDGEGGPSDEDSRDLFSWGLWLV